MWRAMLETVTSDRELIQIVDAAMAEAARLSGAWVVCEPGCADCCLGPFPITQLDAWRLRQGLAQLERRDPERAARGRRRSREAVARMADFPGDLTTGIPDEGEEAGGGVAAPPGARASAATARAGVRGAAGGLPRRFDYRPPGRSRGGRGAFCGPARRGVLSGAGPRRADLRSVRSAADYVQD